MHFAPFLKYLRENPGKQAAETPRVLDQDNQGRVVCPHGCRPGTRHTHGIVNRPLSHRIAHCSGGHNKSYFVRRPFGLLVAAPWWNEPTGPLAFTGAGPGLFREVL
jgi:hypothetical protein